MRKIVDKGLLFQDSRGEILNPEDVDELSAWEIEDRGIRVYDENST